MCMEHRGGSSAYWSKACAVTDADFDSSWPWVARQSTLALAL